MDRGLLVILEEADALEAVLQRHFEEVVGRGAEQAVHRSMGVEMRFAARDQDPAAAFLQEFIGGNGRIIDVQIRVQRLAECDHLSHPHAARIAH